MSKNNIIGLVVIMGLLIGYSLWMSPSKEELEAARRKSDSIAAAFKADSLQRALFSLKQKQLSDSIANLQPEQTEQVADQHTKFGAFASNAQGENKLYTIENDVLRLRISSKGGYVHTALLKNFQSYDSLPLILYKGDSTTFGFEFNTEDLKTLNTNDLYFVPFFDGKIASDSLKVTGKDSLQFAMRLYPAKTDSLSSSYIEFLYTLRPGEYMVGFTVRFSGMKGFVAQNTRDMLLNWQTDLLRQEKSFKNEITQSTIYYMDNTGDVEYLRETQDKKERIPTPVKWISFKNQFFSASLIASEKFESADVETRSHTKDSLRLLRNMSASLVLPFDPSGEMTYSLSWYFGPNKYRTLRDYHLNLEKQIPLGWSFFLMQWINRFAVIPVFNILEKASISYGIIILILTVLLKIVLFPIAFKTYISSAKMRILKPEVDEINAKFPKKEDAMKKQQATMNLYKKAGVNPMAGCVPMLLQFPILLAMFRFFPASFELRQQPFLWAHDLSSYDSVLNLPFTIPFYGDHVSLFCLLMTISTIIYTKINNDMMGSTNQVPGMKTMMYLMPVMFLGFFNSYSSGLSYYYLLANLFTFAQMWLIRKFVNEQKLHARIQENKAKPVKKSSFQKRLEEMAKQKGYKR